MQPIPIGQVLLRLDPAADAATITAQVSAVALDGRGNLWLGAAPLDGIRRLVPTAASGQPSWRGVSTERPTWGDQSALALATLFDLPDPGEPMDLTGMARAGDLLWFVGSHASERLSPDPQLTEAQNLRRLTWAEPIHRRACLGRARITGERLPEPDELALLPVEDGGNALTRALAQDPHLGAYFAPGPIPMAEHGLSLAGLACGAGRLWIGLSGPVLGGFAVVLEVEPWAEGAGVIGLEPIGPDGRPYRKHLIQLDGRGVQALRWRGDSLLILAGPGADADAASQAGIYQLRGALTLEADSLTLADDPRLGLLHALPAGSAPGQWPRAMELYDGLGQPGVMVVSAKPQSSGWGAPEGVVADVYALKGL
jgi:hypothetical protein